MKTLGTLGAIASVIYAVYHLSTECRGSTACPRCVGAAAGLGLSLLAVLGSK